MKAMENILNKIRHDIPPEILEMIKRHDTRDEDNNITLQEYIQEYIIDRYVITELNVNCGQNKNIELKQEYIMKHVEKKYDEHVTFYQIPLDVSERPIVACQNVSFMDTEFNLEYYGKNSIGSDLESMLNSYTFEYENRRVRVDLLDNNIIKMFDEHIQDQKVNCIIGFDSNFTNIPNQSIYHLAIYVLGVLKKHIYTTFSFSVNIDSVISGVRVEALERILDEYRSQTEDTIMHEKLMNIKTGIMIYEPDSLMKILIHAL